MGTCIRRGQQGSLEIWQRKLGQIEAPVHLSDLGNFLKVVAPFLILFYPQPSSETVQTAIEVVRKTIKEKTGPLLQQRVAAYQNELKLSEGLAKLLTLEDAEREIEKWREWTQIGFQLFSLTQEIPNIEADLAGAAFSWVEDWTVLWLTEVVIPLDNFLPVCEQEPKRSLTFSQSLATRSLREGEWDWSLASLAAMSKSYERVFSSLDPPEQRDAVENLVQAIATWDLALQKFDCPHDTQITITVFLEGLCRYARTAQLHPQDKLSLLQRTLALWSYPVRSAGSNKPLSRLCQSLIESALGEQ